MQLVPISLDNHNEALECIKRFGSTSDHNLDWFADSIITQEGKPVFVKWEDGTAILAHQYPKKWRIWSDPLCPESEMVQKITEFATKVFEDQNIEEVWCDDVRECIHPDLKSGELNVQDIDYSLFWPVLDMTRFDPSLPGGHFKEIRNAKNKFFKEHKLEVEDAKDFPKEKLHELINNWKKHVQEKNVYELRYQNAIDDGFRAFSTARVLVVDGIPVGINAGYDTPNKPGRFAGVIGIHDYSVKDVGIILYLEDLEWIKNTGYNEVDLQGSEEDAGLDFKLRFGAKVERKSVTFCIEG